MSYRQVRDEPFDKPNHMVAFFKGLGMALAITAIVWALAGCNDMVSPNPGVTLEAQVSFVASNNYGTITPHGTAIWHYGSQSGSESFTGTWSKHFPEVLVGEYVDLTVSCDNVPASTTGLEIATIYVRGILLESKTGSIGAHAEGTIR